MGHAEVADLYVVVVREQQVLRLDVAMDYFVQVD